MRMADGQVPGADAPRAERCGDKANKTIKYKHIDTTNIVIMMITTTTTNIILRLLLIITTTTNNRASRT